MELGEPCGRGQRRGEDLGPWDWENFRYRSVFFVRFLCVLEFKGFRN